MVLFLSLFIINNQTSLNALSIYFPGTPPKIELLVKNITADNGYYASDVIGNDVFLLTTSSEIPVLSIQKSGQQIGLKRVDANSIKSGNNTLWYPIISLATDSEYVGICEYEYYRDCTQQMIGYSGKNNLQLYPLNSIRNIFYEQFSQDGTTMVFPDWRVEGEVVGLNNRVETTLTRFSITGNYIYTPASEEYNQANKQREKQFQTPRNVLGMTVLELFMASIKGFVILLVLIRTVIVLKNPNLSKQQKTFKLLLMVVVGFSIYFIVVLIDIFLNVRII